MQLRLEMQASEWVDLLVCQEWIKQHNLPKVCTTITCYEKWIIKRYCLVFQVFERILFIWAIRHPASGYVQGINDLVTPFFVVFLSEFVGKCVITFHKLFECVLLVEHISCVCSANSALMCVICQQSQGDADGPVSDRWCWKMLV